MNLRLSLLALALGTTALPALADEVNIYSHRQPELIQPLLDAFTAETGIAVNVAFVDKGMAERLVAEGDRSPADLVLTVDIARLMQVVEAGVTQPVQLRRCLTRQYPCRIPRSGQPVVRPDHAAPASSMPARTAWPMAR